METKYAIRCSTEDEARDVCKPKLKGYNIACNCWLCDEERFVCPHTAESNRYTIISYAEAVEKGLLGEKKVAPSEDFGKSENVIEKIMDTDIYKRYGIL